jgi:hypothetical protein
MPWVLLVLVLAFFFVIITGLLPTPLMDSLEIIHTLQAEGEESKGILKDIRYLNQVECIRNSSTVQERTECSLPL